MDDNEGTGQAGAADGADEDRVSRRRQRIEELKAELVGGELLSAAEVAEILDIHPRTVNEYVREGKLQAIQVGGGWKISERALRAFVRELTTDHAQQEYLAGGGPVTVVESRAGDASPATKGEGPSVAPGSMARSARTPNAPRYKCSFCGKPQKEVRRLIAGPGGVYICNECIALCNGILSKEEAKEAAPE